MMWNSYLEKKGRRIGIGQSSLAIGCRTKEVDNDDKPTGKREERKGNLRGRILQTSRNRILNMNLQIT